MRKTLLFIPMIALGLQLKLVKTAPVDKDAKKISSENDQYRAVIEYDHGNFEYVPVKRFKLQNQEGRVMFELVNQAHTLFDVANSGVVVGLDFDGPVSGQAVLNFYSPTGSRLATAQIGFLGERGFCRDGSVYAVNDGHAGLRVFTAQGKELYNLGRGNWFALAGNGRRVALAQDAAILLFDDGKPAGEIALAAPFLRQMKLSDDGSVLAFADRKDIHLYRVAEAKRLFSYHEANAQLNFISLDISRDNKMVIAGIAEDKGRGAPDRNTRGFIYLFDGRGKIKSRQEIKYANWSAFIPDVSFSANQSIKVKTVDEVHEYTY